MFCIITAHLYKYSFNYSYKFGKNCIIFEEQENLQSSSGAFSTVHQTRSHSYLTVSANVSTSPNIPLKCLSGFFTNSSVE